MIEWIDVGDVTPPRNRTLLCYCPEWARDWVSSSKMEWQRVLLC